MRPVVGRVQIDGDPPHPPPQAASMPLDHARRQLPRHSVERAAARAVLEPRDRWLRRQGRAGHGVPPEQQLVDGILRQVVGVVAVGMTARDAEDPLPISSASVCRIFSGARLSARHPANALTRPYTRSAALSRTAPPSELACSRLNVATRGLSKRSGNRTVCDIVSGVMQGSPLWLNACEHNVYTTRRLLCLPQNHPLHE